MPNGFTGKITDGLGRKLSSARDATGLSTREVASRLAKRVSISHATIANYEKGRTVPNLEVLALLASLYERPLNWFLESGDSLSGIRYRNLKSRVRARDRYWFEAKAQQWLEAYVKLERRLGRRLKSKVDAFEVSPDEPEEEVAKRVRKQAKIAIDAPVPSVVGLLDWFGIRTIELATDLRIDGLAGRFGSEFVVVLNPSTSNDRCRMNAAHELGHVLYNDCDAKQRLSEKEVETRAYGLASHLIMPQKQLEEAFRNRSFVRLVQYKERFGMSIAAMVFRAEQSGVIDESSAKWLWIEMSKRGWRRQEPGHVRADRATRFESLLDEAISRGSLTWRQAEVFLGVSENELRDRLNFAVGLRKDHESEDEEGGDDRPTIKIRP